LAGTIAGFFQTLEKNLRKVPRFGKWLDKNEACHAMALRRRAVAGKKAALSAG
jgi:hypothetical protein